MHDSLLVHLLESSQKTEHELPDFVGREVAIRLLNLVEKLSSSQEFKDHIDGVV